ncbi:brachyurin-like [Penaeus japonicus]|uniref:brachyurin-like n=1 Tax=Penaeus japonicus TaxID=27405 RepID=UPI001C7155DD|nr:brachyurin-like [Penaeus japonicus]
MSGTGHERALTCHTILGTHSAEMNYCMCLLLLIAGVSTVVGNPAAGQQWRWESPLPARSPKPAGSGGLGTRIVGGTESRPHQWPHMVALFVDDVIFCGGSLISDQWVVTAAHCMDRSAFVKVIMGAHNIQEDEPTQVTLTSEDIIVHEEWDSHTLKNDIALIRLPEAVTLNEYISSIGLPDTDLPYGTPVTATGWGFTSDGSSGISNVLNQVTMNVIERDVCDAIFGEQGEGVLCVDASGGGICDGDSGGPLVRENRLYGITSYASALGCESGWPEGFTRVLHYLAWIEEQTGLKPGDSY